MAQIVHDLAPGAHDRLRHRLHGELAFAENIRGAGGAPAPR